jgi:protein gp37
MAENSKINWTDHTFNPWIGCTKVSRGCKFCYAENQTFARVKRSQGVETWGPQGTRVKTSEANWHKPVLWNKRAEHFAVCEICGWRGFPEFVDCPVCHNYKPFIFGVRQRVFCASMADAFEDNPQIAYGNWRVELFNLIRDTPNLDWLLLTKRPENIISMVIWNAPGCRLTDNVWVGASIEDQKAVDRIGHLSEVPARVHFLSVEPMLEPISIAGNLLLDKVDWVICGGESGPKARLFNWDWARDLRDQCKAANVAFWMKQGGGMRPPHELEDLPEDLRIRELPNGG